MCNSRILLVTLDIHLKLLEYITRCRGHSKYVRNEHEAVGIKNAEAVIYFRGEGLVSPPHTPKGGAAVASSAYWFHKPVYYFKYKANNNFDEHHYFRVGRQVFTFFLSQKKLNRDSQNR